MPAEIDIKLDQATAADFFAAVDRAQSELGKSTLSSLQWAARLLCQSLGARTKKSKEKRKTGMYAGANPMPENKGIRRTSVVTYERYKGGHRVVRPLALVATHKADQRQYYRKMYSAEGSYGRSWMPYNRKEMLNDPRLKVGRSGLAKMAWVRARYNITRGGSGVGMGIPLAEVTVNRSFTDPSITISNKLRYAVNALIGGEASVNSAMNSATEKLVTRIGQEVEKRLAKV